MLKSNLSSTLMDAIFFSKLSLGLLPWLFLLTYSWHDTDPPGHRSFLLFLLIAVCPRHCHFPRQGHHCHVSTDAATTVNCSALPYPPPPLLPLPLSASVG